MKRIDYHMHSSYSVDSEEDIEAYCKRAIDLGIEEIALTDHMDFHKGEPPKGLYGNDFLDAYDKGIQEIKKKYDGQLTIRYGIEFGQAHVNLDRMNYLLDNYPYDFVIGSLHARQGIDYSEVSYGDVKFDDFLKAYFEEQYKMVTCSEYDIVGHLDYVRRYIWKSGLDVDIMKFKSEISDILKAIIRKGKGIEINNSARHIKPMETFPHKDILDLYVELGGKCITFGSDAHQAADMFKGYEESCQFLRHLGINDFTTFKERHGII